MGAVDFTSTISTHVTEANMQNTTLYHHTDDVGAFFILKSGFADHDWPGMPLRGVRLFDRPVDQNEGAPLDADVLLAVHLTIEPGVLADCELRETGKPYREWCVPASLLRKYATAHRLFG